MSQFSPDKASPLKLGRGFNSVTQSSCGDGIRPAKAVKQSGDSLGGQDVTYTQKEVTSYSDIRSELSVSASASFQAQFGSGSAAATYTNSLVITRYAYFLLIKIEVLNETETLESYALNEGCSRDSEGQSQDFLDTYGDEFVAAQTTGGTLIAVYQFEFDTSEQRSALSAQVSGGGMVFKGGAEWKQAFDKIDKSSVKNVFLHKTAGGRDLPPADDFVQYALGFPRDVAANPKVSLFTTVPYIQASDKPRHPHFPKLELSRRQLNLMLLDREKAAAWINEMEYALHYKWQFEPFDEGKLRTSQADLKSYIVRLDTVAQHILDDPLHRYQFNESLPTVQVPAWVPPSTIDFNFRLNILGLGEQVYAGNSTGGVADARHPIDEFLLSFAKHTEGMGCKYQIHTDVGDSPWMSDGTPVGDPNSGRWMLGIAIKLKPPMDKVYSVWYYGMQHIGLGFIKQVPAVSDGQFLGSTKPGEALLQINIKIVRKLSLFATKGTFAQWKDHEKRVLSAAKDKKTAA